MQQIVNSPRQALIASSFQLTSGSWESAITYSSSISYVPPTGYLEPPDGDVPGRTTGVVRDPVTNLVLQRTYADGSTESYAYNSFNEVTNYVDQLGNSSSWTYDSRGNMLSHAVPATTCGTAAESWSYNSQGQVLTYTDFNSNVTSYVYSGGTGELQAVVLAGGGTGSVQPSGTVGYGYTGLGLVNSTTDAYGRVVSFGFDAANRLGVTSYADSSTETVNYNASSGTSNPAQLGGTLDRNGNETDFAYYTSGGSTGLLHTVSVHQGSSTGSVLSTTTKFYDPVTLMPTEMVVDGSETDQSYDYLNRVVTTTVHPSSTLTLTSSSVYNRYQLLQTVDYYLRATSYVYDLMNRPLTVTQELRPGGPSITTSRQYNPAGLTTAAVDGNNNRSLFYFDQRQRPVKTTVAACTPLEATTQTVYDANSNVLTRIDERGNAWPSTYTVRNQAATSADPLGDTTYNSYTTDGLLLSTTNANGHTSTNSYYPCCPRLLKVTDQYGNYKTFYYDFNGNTTQITDESGRTFNWTYDGMNRQTLMIAASGSLNLTSSTFYSPPPALGTIGASTTAVNPAGQTIVSSFDGMGRMLSTSGNTAPMSYTYDATFGTGAYAGLVMTAVVTGSGGTTLSTSALADGAGRTVRSFDGLGNSVYMTYDNNSNLLSTTDQDNRATVNAYDARNRLTSTQQNTGGQFTTTSYSYDPTNNTTQVVDAEGKTTRYGYDLANRRTSTTYAYGTADARTWGMTYTPLGQLAALAKPGGVNIAYGYDNRELLLTRTYMQGSGTLGTDVFTYSPKSAALEQHRRALSYERQPGHGQLRRRQPADARDRKTSAACRNR